MGLWLTGHVASRLLVSLSGASAPTLPVLTEITAELRARSTPVALFVRPRGVAASPVLADWVRSRVHSGDDLLIHGYGDPIPQQRPVLRSSRAEFAGLSEHEAGLRISAATSAMAQAGIPAREVTGFAPPGWMVSDGTLTALRKSRLALCADGGRVHDLRTGTVHRGRVFPFGGGGSERAEALRCFALLLTVARMVNRVELLRLHIDATQAVRPGPRQAFLDAVDIALEAGAVPQAYRQLVARKTDRSGKAA
uniref:DUF2334 domain-containing protein n=1 Tax=Thermocrispum agreste TaxID=37925 RepID=A0A2W4LBW5_9PSEU|nr:MAG: DUF2334 domain-containing protein [Thermocrispum agreste]